MVFQRNTSVRPFSGLSAAIYLLKCVSEGLTKDQITYGRFSGDTQQVNTLVDFLKDKHWLEEKKGGGKMKLTHEGKSWKRRYGFSIEER